MDERKPDSCGLEAALAVISGKWKLLILWRLAPSPRRFGDLGRCVHGIREKMLIQQLRELEADGIVTRKCLGEVPPHVVYSLTPLGESLVEALQPLSAWGTAHKDQIAASPAHKPSAPSD